MTTGCLLSRLRRARSLPAIALAAALMGPMSPVPARAQSCEAWRLGPFSTGGDGVDGTVSAFCEWDPDGAGPLGPTLVVGGSFTIIEGTSVTNLAMRDVATGSWVPVGPNGSAPPVNALCVFEGKLVVGSSGDNNVGTFDQTVRTWDGSVWQSLGTTNTGSVRALAVYANALYIGGSFWTTNTTGVTAAQEIARWNAGLNAWDYLDSGSIDGQVLALTVWSGELVVGGSFTIVAGNPNRGVVRWNGSSWLSMGLQSGAVVNTLQPYIGGLYAGGGGLNDGVTAMGGLGRWNGSSWSSASGNFGGAVNRLNVYNGRLIVAGTFSGTSANITQYDGGTYTGMGSGIGTTVSAIFPYGGVLWVGGSFTTAGGNSAQHLARWNGSGWSTVGGGSVGSVLAMTDFVGTLVAGGAFSQSTYSTQPAVNIVQWNGTSMSPFGSGMNGQVNALKSFKYSGPLGSYELIAGGYFTTAGGVAANRIARWNMDPFGGLPVGWQAMGPGMDGAVLAIERFNNTTYAGGNFYWSGTTALASIGRWNESTDQWENIVGANGPVYALKSYGGYLYAGGSFTAIGGVSTGGFARYNGSGWSQCGGYFLGSVYALEIFNGVLAVGGDFTGINASPDLAWYNGSGYGTYATGGSNAAVTALHANGSRLYVGGTFTTMGGLSASHVAYWDNAWHGLNGGGTDNTVYAFGNLGGEENVGGSFHVEGAGIWSPGWGRYSSTGLPWFTQQPSNQNVTSGVNVTFTARPAPGYGVTLQWYRKGSPASNGATGTGSTISGVDQETLILENVSTADAGHYQLVATNSCGSVSSYEATLTIDGITAAPPSGPVTADALEGFGPNPTRGPAQLAFALARDERVRMSIHDIAGRLVRRIDAGALAAGHHQLTWDGRDEDGQAVRTGLYLVRVDAADRTLGTRRLVVQR